MSDPLSKERIDELTSNVNDAVRACTPPLSAQQVRAFKMRETILALLAERAALLKVAEAAVNHLNASYCIPARDVNGTRDDLNVALIELQATRTRAG
jgi:hypothetical protein